jgi:hypothetical protein
LAQAGVDHFHTGIAQGAGNDFGAAVVAIEARLGNEYSDFAVWGHFALFALRDSLLAFVIRAKIFRAENLGLNPDSPENHKP